MQECALGPRSAAHFFLIPEAVLAAGIAACSGVSEVPEAVRVPAGQRLALELFASGVQIYECAAVGDGAGYQWKVKASDAVLLDPGGRPMGTQYAGPTWKAPDGSSVVGEVRGRAPSSDPASIPLLLLEARRGDGDGVFSRVRSIQRLGTVGGRAPETSCNATQVSRVARVRFTAKYYFYE